MKTVQSVHPANLRVIQHRGHRRLRHERSRCTSMPAQMSKFPGAGHGLEEAWSI